MAITMHDKRTNISKDAVARIKKVFRRKVFRTIISKSVKLEESPAYKESIFTFAPYSVGAKQYQKLAEENFYDAIVYHSYIHAVDGDSEYGLMTKETYNSLDKSSAFDLYRENCLSSFRESFVDNIFFVRLYFI